MRTRATHLVLTVLLCLAAPAGCARQPQLTIVNQSSKPIRKAAAIPEDGMSQALRDGAWKRVFNTQNEAVAPFDPSADLIEKNNIANAQEQSARMDHMVKLCAEIRQSTRSASAAGNGESGIE